MSDDVQENDDFRELPEYKTALAEFRERHLKLCTDALQRFAPIDVMGSTMGATVEIGEKSYGTEFTVKYVADMASTLRGGGDVVPFTPKVVQ